uniref:GPN-loop GTPase 2 n=1 Tax=Timema shepardi TaxID=629360 RepID=A0A7R9FW96_TIMSH|nr:unnamed protein product [Timema shepardi]
MSTTIPRHLCFLYYLIYSNIFIRVELYTHHNSVKNIMESLSQYGFHLCTVHLVDSHYCSEPGKFISTLLLSLSAMMQIELPHINVLSKVDLLAQYGDKLLFGLDYYTEVLDLNYLLEALDDDPLTRKYVLRLHLPHLGLNAMNQLQCLNGLRYRKLNAAIISLVEDYGLVSFIPLNIKDKNNLLKVKNAVDKANGYIYGSGEETSVQALLACAVGAEYESERVGSMKDTYENFAPMDSKDVE